VRRLRRRLRKIPCAHPRMARASGPACSCATPLSRDPCIPRASSAPRDENSTEKCRRS
jgi:hypothetical protein